MGRKLVLSDGAVAQEMTVIRAAKNGAVEDIKKGCVAEGGFVRQFWPPAASSVNTQLQWTTDPITVTESVLDPADSIATLVFNTPTGEITYDNYPNPMVTEPYINPPLTFPADQDKYLIRAVHISGAPITGLGGYEPGYLTFDGSDSFTVGGSLNPLGNKVTAVIRFNIASFPTATKSTQILFQYAKSLIRFRFDVSSNDNANAEVRGKLRVRVHNSAGAFILDLISQNVVTDGQDHICFASFDGDNGLATFIIDGQDADDLGFSSRILTTGVLEGGGSFAFGYAADQSATQTVIGDLSYFGYRDVYLTNHEDFMIGNAPLPLDETTWTEWGAQPLYWNAQGKMDDNKGSASNMTRNGSPVETAPIPADTGWLDLSAASTYQFSLDQLEIGTSTAQAEISLAVDRGDGLPDPGSDITKPVTFDSTVRESGGGTSLIVWPLTQRDLVDIRDDENAECILTFSPLGYAVGDANTSGAFSDDWHADSPAVADPENYTVQVDLVSGTAPSGASLGVALALDVGRQWTLATVNPGDNLSCELDVTVDDTIAPATRRITMNSQRAEAPVPPVWTTDLWQLSDVTFKQALGLIQTNTISFNTGGTCTGSCTNNTNGGVQESDPWLPGGENPADYEAKMETGTGGTALVNKTAGQWYNLGTNQDFIIEYVTINNPIVKNWTISVRKIGQLPVDRPLEITTAGDSGEPPP